MLEYKTVYKCGSCSWEKEWPSEVKKNMLDELLTQERERPAFTSCPECGEKIICKIFVDGKEQRLH